MVAMKTDGNEYFFVRVTNFLHRIKSDIGVSESATR